MPGRCVIVALFIIHQLQKKYMAANKALHKAFVGLENTLGGVPRKNMVMWMLGVEEWLVRMAQICGREESGKGW